MAAVVAIQEAIIVDVVVVAVPFSVATTIVVSGLSSYCYSSATTITTVIAAAIMVSGTATMAAVVTGFGSSFCYSAVTEIMVAANPKTVGGVKTAPSVALLWNT